jgi:hypothetical protein
MSNLEFTVILLGLFNLVALVLRGLQRWLDRPKGGRTCERDDHWRTHRGVSRCGAW